MGTEMEVFKDSEGNHLIFDKSALYDDSQMGENLADFEVLRVLGSFNNENIISKVRSLKNNKIYAMKKIELDKLGDLEKNLCFQQIEKLKTINHPHLLKYYKTFKDDKNNLYMIYEYMNNSDLNSFIKAHQTLEKNIKEEEIWNILLQCLSGLAYLHKENLAYLAIKPTNIFLDNEQKVKIGLFYDTPKIEYKNYNIKRDIYFIGLYFYKMCYSLCDDIRASYWIDEFEVKKRNNAIYSNELLNIIFEMLNEDEKARKSSGELYQIVKNEYVKKFTNNTSINSVLRCLYTYTNFNNEIFKNENSIMNQKEKYHISYWYLKTMKALNQNQNLNECLEEFRRALASENSKMDGSKEVNPVYLIAFLFEKMHKEGNKKNKTEIKAKNINEQYVINSSYKAEEEEDKTNKDTMLNKFIYYFKDNIFSIISNLFFGFIKRKRICDSCKHGTYTFSNFCLVPFDLTKFDNENLQFFDLIKDGFYKEYIQEKVLEKDVYHVFCDRCLTEQKHYEFNRYYSMNFHLTICFYRGSNYQNNLNIIFPEYLDISKYVEARGSPDKYILVGSINRVINNGKEEFVYFTRDPKKTNYWNHTYGDGPCQSAPIKLIQQTGQIIMLFYNYIK
jgi:serine/threonine protein kinase